MAWAVCKACGSETQWNAVRGARLADHKCVSCGGELRARRSTVNANSLFGKSIQEVVVAIGEPGPCTPLTPILATEEQVAGGIAGETMENRIPRLLGFPEENRTGKKTYHVEQDWISEAGLRCIVIKSDDYLRHRCGYVGIDGDHFLYGIEYGQAIPELGDAPEEYRGWREYESPESVFRVHGGITYSGGGAHYPVESEGIWWFGFDCAHYMDGQRDEGDGGGRPLEYVVAECEQLARQLADAKPVER